MSNPAPHNGKIVRSELPLNLEMPFEKLDGFVTPTEQFYVRTHFPIPEIDVARWDLRVEGEVENPLHLNYDALRKLPSRTIPVTLECAGNSRNFLQPKVQGVAWGLGAVGTAEWTGVPLSVVLQRAIPRPGAIEVILEGADEGPLSNSGRPDRKVSFARSIPLAKALDDVLLVYKMNGEELRPEHGFPVRAIVPGWYAMASIKWLQRIKVTDRAFKGYYQTLDYSYWSRRDGLTELLPLSTLQLKSEISRPMVGEKLPGNSEVTVRGAAWTGEGEIAKVELSTDGGATWHRATLTGESKPYAWRLWEYRWRTPAEAGKYTLISRATDSLGNVQVSERDPDRGTYMINHLLPIEVEIQ